MVLPMSDVCGYSLMVMSVTLKYFVNGPDHVWC